MMILQSQVTLLDRYVIQQESIPNMLPPLGARHVPLQFVNRGSDVANNVSKNVCMPVENHHIYLLLAKKIFMFFFPFTESKYVVLKVCIIRYATTR